MNADRPYPLNAPGPFFVADGQCIACGAPEAEAPDLIRFDDDSNHCFFARQPATAAEIDQALRAVLVACCDAVHYGGADPTALGRLPVVKAQIEKENEARRRDAAGGASGRAAT